MVLPPPTHLPEWYYDGMSSDTTAPTWQFHLRASAEEKAIVQRVIEAHAQQGLKISQNQALIVLIRRGASPDPDTKEEAWRKIEQHWTECPADCSYDQVNCPEGWRLHDVFHRTPGTIPPRATQRPTAAPPRAEPVPPAWRRLLSVGRAG